MLIGEPDEGKLSGLYTCLCQKLGFFLEHTPEKYAWLKTEPHGLAQTLKTFKYHIGHQVYRFRSFLGF